MACCGQARETQREVAQKKGPKRDLIILNAAAALYVSGIVGSIRQAIPIAEDAIDSGKVMVKFNQFRTFTGEFYQIDKKQGFIPGKTALSPSRVSMLSPASGEQA